MRSSLWCSTGSVAQLPCYNEGPAIVTICSGNSVSCETAVEYLIICFWAVLIKPLYVHPCGLLSKNTVKMLIDNDSENRIAVRQLLQNRKLRHLWCHNLGSRWKLQKMARENFSIRAFYNITKNQDNPIKTVGRDSFLSPKTPQNTSF